MSSYCDEILQHVAKLSDAARILDLHIKTLEMDYRHLHEDYAPSDNPDNDEYLQAESSLESLRHQINLLVLNAINIASIPAVNPGFPKE